MKICHVSTFWPTRSCSFTYYTDSLIKGMQANRPERHYVAGDRDCESIETEHYTAAPCFHFDDDYVDRTLSTIRGFGVDLVVIQFTWDLFGEDDRMLRLVRELKKVGIAVVLNLHSIFPEEKKSAFKPGGDWGHFDRAIAAEADALTVHTSRMRKDLLLRGIAGSKVIVIPHGTRTMEQRDQAESRRQLGLPVDAKVVLFFGFVWLGKGLDFLLNAFSKVARELPDAWLYIGGYTRQKAFYTHAYMNYLKARQWLLGIKKRTLMYGDFVPDELVPTIYSAADVVAMPYLQNYSSASGVVHQTAGIGKLMLCSDIAKFDQVGQLISPALIAQPKNRDEWATKMIRLLSDDELAAEMRGRISHFGRQTSWEELGKRHLALYDAILEGKQPDSVGAEWQLSDLQARDLQAA